MNSLTIRDAKEADVVVIEDIIYKWIRWKRERADAIRKVLHDKNHQILVAEVNDKVIGVLHQIFYPDIMLGGLNCHINLLLIEEEHRCKGRGSQLLKKAIECAKDKGAIEMHVDTIYKEAADFYQKHGFKDDGFMFELVL